jgi:hypothetical protein
MDDPRTARAGCGVLAVSEKPKFRRFLTAMFAIEAVMAAFIYIWVFEWVISWFHHPK